MVEGQNIDGLCSPDAWNGNVLVVKRMVDLFYSDDPEDIDQAKSICAECPARIECMEQGATEEWGIWGGTTPQERGYDHE